eukprot:SAG31_NODE_21619_length_545_cov_0.901345_1_plen_99_part_10
MDTPDVYQSSSVTENGVHDSNGGSTSDIRLAETATLTDSSAIVIFKREHDAALCLSSEFEENMRVARWHMTPIDANGEAAAADTGSDVLGGDGTKVRTF